MAYPVKHLLIGGRPVSQFVIAYDGSRTYGAEAAHQLAEYLRKATGAVLPVAPYAGGKEPMILIGVPAGLSPALDGLKAGLKNDGIVYLCEGPTLYLDSESEIGLFYVVSRFLQEKIGCRFYDDDNFRVIPADEIGIPDGFSYTFSSPLMYRQTDWRVSRNECRLWCMNAGEGIENTILGFCHTMGRLSETSDDAQPCLTDEHVYQTVLKNVRELIKKNPGCRIVSVTQNDNQKYCTCPRCQALAEKEGQSGVMLNFVNRLAEEIEKDYPDVYLLTFAYQYTRKPPVTIKPRDNVIIWLCSIECCFSHALSDASCAHNEAFARDLKTWGELSKNLFIWDYATNYAHYVATFPNFAVLRENARFFTELGSVAIYEEGGHQQRENGEFRSLRAYLIGQLLWNPFMSEAEYDALIRDFLEGFYGAGWRNIYEFIQKTCEKAKKVTLSIYIDLREMFVDDEGKMDIPFVEEMHALWQKAIAEADSDVARQNCLRGSTQSELLLAVAKAVQNGGTPDVALNYKVWGMMLGAGIRFHREGWGAWENKVLVDKITDEIARTKSPNEWN